MEPDNCKKILKMNRKEPNYLKEEKHEHKRNFILIKSLSIDYVFEITQT